MLAVEAVEEWIEALQVEGRSSSTREAYRRHVLDTLGEIARSQDAVLAELPCSALSRAGLRRAVASYQSRGDLRGKGGSAARARSSVQARIAALRGFAQWALEEGYVEGLLTQGLRGGGGRAERAAHEQLGRDGAARVIAAAGEGRNGVRDQLVCTLMLELGLSAREVASVRAAEAGERAGRWYVVAEAKRELAGARARRELELPRASREALQAWQSQRGKLLARRGVSSEWLVVTGRDEASVEVRARVIAAAVERAMRRAGEEGRSHRLRATHVQLSLEAGASIPEVAARTGVHSLPALKAMLGESPGVVGARSIL